MSSASQKRQLWKCPQCGRSYRIPAGTDVPRRCPGCESQASSTPVQAVTPPGTMTFQAKSQPAPFAEAVEESSVVAKGDQAAKGQPELSEILEHLRNISRTMTLMRRSVWLFIIISVLSTVLLGYSLLKFIQPGEQPGQGGQLELQKFLDAL